MSAKLPPALDIRHSTLVTLDWSTVWLEIEASRAYGGFQRYAQAWLKGKPDVKIAGLSTREAALNLAKKVYWPNQENLPANWPHQIRIVHAGARGPFRRFCTRLKPSTLDSRPSTPRL